MTVNLNIFILLFQFILLNSYGQYGVSEGGDSKDAWSMRLYADDKMTGYGLNTGYSDKEKKEYYLRCIRDIP